MKYFNNLVDKLVDWLAKIDGQQPRSWKKDIKAVILLGAFLAVMILLTAYLETNNGPW